MSRAVIAEKATHAGEKAMEMLDKAPNVVSRARSLVSGDAQFFSTQPKMDVIRKLLDSDSIQEKKDGMKRVIAQICKGVDMSSLFPDVVKNILIQSIELRKLVYYFIVHYAEERPNEALLSISAFQRDLVDSSMHVRSLALRMLSSIRISAIQPVVMVAIKKCATDMSPIVRKTAAISLAQMHSISTGDESEMILIPLLEQFFGDKTASVAAAAALSMIEICPNRMDIIHKHFRKICRSLAECDEWGQVILMHVLLRYCRTQFLDPNRKEEKKEAPAAPAAGDDDDSSSSSDSEVVRRRVGRGNEALARDLEMDSDHRLLLSSVKPLILSMNRAVVVGAASLYFHCSPTDELDTCVKPLLRLLGGPDGHAVVLSAIHTFVLSRPQPFIPHIKEFFINSEDTSDVRDLKIRIISKLTTQANFTPVVHEFRSYLRSFDVKKVIQALHGLSLISCVVSDSSTQIMRLITPLLSHKNTDVITESVVILRQLVVQGTDKNQTCKLVHRLLQQVMKDEIKSTVARASILWLVGENIATHIAIAQAAPDCFRAFVKNFHKEDPQVKKQVITLGSKIWLHLDGEGTLAARFKQLFFYVLELVKYDADYEVRDLGRTIECTIDRQSATFASMKAAVLAVKPPPQQNDPFLEKAKYQLGSLSHLFGNALLGYQELPAWPLTALDVTVRDPPGETKSDDSASSRSNYSTDESGSDSSSDSDSSESSAASSSSASSSASSSSNSSSSSASSGRRGSHQRIASPLAKKAVKKAKAPAVVAVKKLVINRVGAPAAPTPAAAATPAAAVAKDESPEPAKRLDVEEAQAEPEATEPATKDDAKEESDAAEEKAEKSGE